MKKNKEHCEEVARIAYEIYQMRGTPGQEVDDWLEAERIVMERIVSETTPPPVKSVVLKKKTAQKKTPAKKAPQKKTTQP